MKKMGVILMLVCVGLVVAACNNVDETDSASETPSKADEDIDETEPTDGKGSDESEEDSVSDDVPVENADEGSHHEDGAEEPDYTEEQVAEDFIIYSDRLESFDLMFYFTRTAEDMTREERFHQSLIESDPSQRDLFSAVVNFELDGTVANFYYNEDDVLSMASTESAQFWEVLHEIGFRYGIEEFNLFNQDGGRGPAFAGNTWEEPVEIEQEPNRGYLCNVC